MTVERHSIRDSSDKELHGRGVVALEKIGDNLESINAYIKEFLGFVKEEMEDEKAYIKSLKR